MWIELPSPTMAKLNKVAREKRREPREQAAYFVECALARAEADAERVETDKVPTPA
jgi:hypothetical protein